MNTRNDWTYMLRILRRKPDQIPMERIGEYIVEFAKLLGGENHPVFKGVKSASTGLKARVAPEYQHHCHLRLIEARDVPDSGPARSVGRLSDMLGEDGLNTAQLLDRDGKIVHILSGRKPANDELPRLYQDGFVDGLVVGLVGADDTMHLHLREATGSTIRFILREEGLARQLLEHFRRGSVRLYAHGLWKRTESGWLPESGKCTVDRFEALEETSLIEVFSGIAANPDNGWNRIADPIEVWKTLRGIH